MKSGHSFTRNRSTATRTIRPMPSVGIGGTTRPSMPSTSWSSASSPGREAPRKREDLSRIGQIMLDGTAIDEAVRAAVRDAIVEHARDGAPIVIERDGQIVEIPAEEILREQAAREARRAKHARRA